MRTDTVLRCDGMKILSEHLGIVEAERFIMLMNREPFDYTRWRQNLFVGVPVEEFLENARQFAENRRKNKQAETLARIVDSEEEESDEN